MSKGHVSDRDTYAKIIEDQIGEDIRIHCQYCETETYHKVLAHVRCTESQYFYQDDYDGFTPGGGDIRGSVDFWEDYYTIQCHGCRKVSIYLTQYFSEDEDWTKKRQFPDDPIPSRDLFGEKDSCPEAVARIYKEAVSALDNDMPILAGVGIRAVLEAICKECKTEGSNLYMRIDAMVDLGFITKDDAQILHSLRMLGNKAAHDVTPNKLSELDAAFDIIDHLLRGVYTIRERAKTIPK